MANDSRKDALHKSATNASSLSSRLTDGLIAGAIPFSVIRRLDQAFIYWVGVIIGLVICGCLLIVVSVSLMFP